MDLYRCDQSFDAGERILRYSLSGSGLTVLLRSAGFLVNRKSVLFCNAAELFPQTIEIVLLIHDARNQRFHRFAPLSETLFVGKVALHDLFDAFLGIFE